MLIFFGTRGSTLPPISTGQDCPACGGQHSISVIPYQRYFHIFWIPVLPIGKSFNPVCASCGAIFHPMKLQVTMDVKKQAKTPLWTYIGLILIGVLIGFVAITGMITSTSNKKLAKEYINTPQVGDVYEIKENKKYSLLKVDKVSADSIYFRHHEYETNRNSKLKDLKKGIFADAYSEEVSGESKTSLLKQLDDRKIIKIER